MDTNHPATSHANTLMPTLFASHGAPPFALAPGMSGLALNTWAKSLVPAPRGVVVLSPHWIARGPSVMCAAQPATWHDFSGFPAELYQLQYPAPGAPTLAQEILDLLQRAAMPAQPDLQRPFDHGAWVVLMHLFPQANVPVVQLALPFGWNSEQIYALGAALQGLRASGVLLVGSGSMTHNLSEFSRAASEPAPYVAEFCRWIEARLAQGDIRTLFNYLAQAPHARRAHPSDDHFLPLFFALGAAGAAARPHYLSREVLHGMLAMDTLVLQ